MLSEGRCWLFRALWAASCRRLSRLSTLSMLSTSAGGLSGRCCDADASTWNRQKSMMAQQAILVIAEGMASGRWAVCEGLGES